MASSPSSPAERVCSGRPVLAHPPVGHPRPTAAAVEGLTQCGGRRARSAALEGALCSDGSRSQVVRIRAFSGCLGTGTHPSGVFANYSLFSAKLQILYMVVPLRPVLTSF